MWVARGRQWGSEGSRRWLCGVLGGPLGVDFRPLGGEKVKTNRESSLENCETRLLLARKRKRCGKVRNVIPSAAKRKKKLGTNPEADFYSREEKKGEI